MKPENETNKDVAQYLMVSVPTVSQRAKYLRGLGVNLPNKVAKRGRPTKLEIAQLNSLISKLSKQ